MFGPRNGKNKVHSSGCGRRTIVETLMRSFMIIEVEISGQSGMQLSHCVILVEIDVLVFDAVL